MTARTTEIVESQVGYSAFGQKVLLRGGTDTAGKWSWTIVMEPRNFREQQTRIEGLTRDSILAIAAVIERDGR